MVTSEESERLIGATVLDPSSARIGEVRQVFVDAATDAPAWVGVRVGLFGGEVLVPLEGADWDERALRAAVTRSSARSAPEVDLDEPLSVEEHERVCRHYGIPSTCYPREDLDPALFEGTISYSVQEDDMTENAKEQAHGDAMAEAEATAVEGVSGHMLAPAPAALDDSRA